MDKGITAMSPSGRFYEVQDSLGRTYTLGRELLRMRIQRPNSESPLVSRHYKNKQEEKENAVVQLRRSSQIICSLEDHGKGDDEETPAEKNPTALQAARLKAKANS